MAKGNKKTVGDWTWNSEVLWKKIVQTDKDSCWAWLGSVGPQTNLFGAQKQGKAQMTQARRILFRDVTNTDCDDSQIKMKCNNAYCMNYLHFELQPNQRKYRLDGTDRTIERKQEKPKVKQAKLKPVQAQTRWWQV